MRRYILLRFLRMLLASWFIVSGIFLLSRTLPTTTRLLQFTGGEVGMLMPNVDAQRQAEQRLQQRLELDEPVFYFSRRQTKEGKHWEWNGIQNQYHQWLWRLLHGDIGRSYRDGQPVALLLTIALRYTLPLTLLAVILSLSSAVWLATHLAIYPRNRSWLLRLLYVLDALPLFTVALLLLLLFANPDVLVWFPAYGLGQIIESPDDSLLARASEVSYYLVLPLLSLLLVTVPSLVMQMDGALQREQQSDYAATARAKGASQPRVVRHHLLRNALLPSIAQLADLLPAIVAGTVVVETVFALPGIGRLLVEAAQTRDYPVLIGGVLLTVVARLVAQLATDSLYVIADPRIRLQL